MTDIPTNSKKITYIGLFITLSLIFSYIETVLPVNFGIPGVKLGLANIVTVFILFEMGEKEAYLVTILRIILSAFLFSNMYSLIYSLSGGFLSLAIMHLTKKLDKLSVVGVSMCGGVFHNIGQLVVACIVVKSLKISFYGPVLLISGLITGTVIGFITRILIKRLKRMFEYDRV